ncbi:Crp/Fnr family transcriptional regulator [Paractinoplanes atraurantiacus]|uniref:cAMP-binding domain of CRP or a regulatory subunit of cAMP-dependent protein kinases n=1 Tax=Paractinoplanes atraurantiacus TaxID=1036182 RepID=A0A285J7U2_9ACTN|nr:Crp/Fnr family transcriptional regulator [Actinoplanes atraurantiacus]SNY55406.1 cAMP-binding domain of CRP or a regulatory subunit of cAMP-dependent protein kinases [Actinoplanes atraurantiacus]
MEGRQRYHDGTFLAGLSDQERIGLFRLGKRKDFLNGSYVLRQQDRGRDVFVVLHGRVEIFMLDRRRRPQRIAVRVPGDVLGEMAYVDGRHRSASVIAAGLVVTHSLPAASFDRYLREFPSAYRHLTRTLIDRLRAADNRQVEIGSDVESRLAAALYHLATQGNDQNGAHVVRRTQRELGQMIGASTVSVHRALRKLAGRDCVRTEYREIVVLDLDSLASAAGTRTTMHRLM